MPQQPQPSATEPIKPAPKLTHKHTNNETYQFTCKACRQADAARSAPDVRSINDEDLVRTTFLIPATDYDNKVCRAYIDAKYPDATYVGSSLDLAKLGGWAEGEQIVVVRRDTWPRQPGPGSRREKDVEDRWQYIPIEPETYLHECVESAPIDVRATMVVTKADRFTKSTLDNKPLLARLAELMAHPYRIDLPRNENDSELHFVHA